MTWHPSPEARTPDPAWVPLLLLARAALRGDVGWAVNALDFSVLGEIRRRGKPTVVVYQHTRTAGVVGVDGTGQAWRISVDSAGRTRVAAITAHAAVFLVRIPSVDDPLPIPSPALAQPQWEDPPLPPPPRQPQGHARRRRRVGKRPGADRSHLRVV